MSSNSPTSASRASRAAAAAVRWPRARASAASRSRKVASITSVSARPTGSISEFNLFGIAHDGELCAGDTRALNHLRRDGNAVGEHDRVAAGECGALRPLRHAERGEAVGEQRPARLFFEEVAETFGPAMRHHEGSEAPTRPTQDGAGCDGAQSIAGLALGADRVEEIAAGERHGLAAADDLQRAVDLVELASGEEARQPRYMIEMKVGQQHVAEPAKAEPGAHQLALCPLAAVDEKPGWPAGDQQGGRAPLGGGHGRGGAEKDQIEHGACRNLASGRKCSVSA